MKEITIRVGSKLLEQMNNIGKTTTGLKACCEVKTGNKVEIVDITFEYPPGEHHR